MISESERAPTLPEALSEKPRPQAGESAGGSGTEPGGDQTFPVRAELGGS